MSDFWGLSDGGSIAPSSSFEIDGGGPMDPIPDGTQVLASIDEAKWDTKDEAEYISLRWTVMKPETYKNRKVFQKLWVLGNNPQQKDKSKAQAQGDKAKRMLAAIDTNAGGKLMAAGGKPTDTGLQSALIGKPMIVKLGVWEMSGSMGDKMVGNWVQMVASREIAQVHEAPKQAQRKVSNDVDEDSIPF